MDNDTVKRFLGHSVQ